MERWREGRRGAVGASSVSAARRPRTIGSKEVSDCDDTVSDAPNQKLRDGPKKENNSPLSIQEFPVSNLGSTSRTKRRRQESQEIQDQVRSGIVDEVHEMNNDIQTGISDEDDDPPPPSAFRRASKGRPQGKFLEDVVSADHPTIPRKARTALKRTQEAASPPLTTDGSSHQRGPTISRQSAHQNAPSSISAMICKARPRKPVGSKNRASKEVPGDNQTPFSEKEVEVVEALFDLSRLSANKPISLSPNGSLSAVSRANLDAEPTTESGLPEPGVITGCLAVSSAPSEVSLVVTPCDGPSEILVNDELPLVAIATSMGPVDSPHDIKNTLPAAATVVEPLRHSLYLRTPTAPPAEAPKRKRPRLRKRLDETNLVAQIAKDEHVKNARGSSDHNSRCSTSKSAEIGVSLSHDKKEDLAQTEVRMRSTAATPLAPVSVKPSTSALRAVNSEISSPQMSVNGGIVPDGRISLGKMNSKPVTSSRYTLEGGPMSTSAQPYLPSPMIVGSTVAGSILRMGTTLHCPSACSADTDMELIARRSQDATASTNERPEESLINSMVDQESKIKCSEHERMHASRFEQENTECQAPYRKESGEENGLDENRICGAESQSDLINVSDQVERTQNIQQSTQTSHALRLNTRTDVAEVNDLNLTTSTQLLTPVLPSFSTLLTSEVGSVSASPPRWPPGLPSFGYCTDGSVRNTKVCWPEGLPFTACSSRDEHVRPPLEAQQPYTHQSQTPLSTSRRCATHIRIAHFIDAQQQMNRHPLIQAAYENSGNGFAQKAFCHELPFGHGGALFGGGLRGQFVNGPNGVDRGSFITGSGGRLIQNFGNDRTYDFSTSKASSLIDNRYYIEELSRKPTDSQLMQPSHMPSILTAQAPSIPASRADGSSLRIGTLAHPTLGFPISQTSTASGINSAKVPSVTGDPATGRASILGNSACATETSAPGITSGTFIDDADAQALYIQKVMQQGGYPYAFEGAVHFGTTCDGRGTQQATQLFHGPFFTSQMLHSPQQRAQHTLNVAAAGLMANPIQNQHQSSGRTFLPSSPQQRQPSMHYSVSSRLASQQQAVAIADQSAEREGISAGDGKAINNKLPLSEKTVSAASSSDVVDDVPVSLANSPSLVPEGIALTRSSSQHFNLVTAVGSGLGTEHDQDRAISQHSTAEQQQQLAQQSSKSHLRVQHQASAIASSAVGLKGPDRQLSDAIAGKASTEQMKVIVGAPVMASPGHAFLHTISRSTMGPGQHEPPKHQSLATQLRQGSIQPLQHSRAIQVQGGLQASDMDDCRTFLDGNLLSSRKDATDERKAVLERGAEAKSKQSTVDAVKRKTVHGSLRGGLVVSRANACGTSSSTLNLFASTSSVLNSRACGPISDNDRQIPGSFMPSTLSTKHATSLNKTFGNAGSSNVVTTMPSHLSRFGQGQPPTTSLPDRVPGHSLSLAGPILGSSDDISKQISCTQNVQSRPPDESHLASASASSSLPTTGPQAIFAAVMAKSQQGMQQRHPGFQTQETVSTGPSPILSASSVSPIPASVEISLSSAGRAGANAEMSSSASSICITAQRSAGAAVKHPTSSKASCIATLSSSTTTPVIPQQQHVSNLLQISFLNAASHPPAQLP